MHNSQYPRDVTAFVQGQSAPVKIDSIDPRDERIQVTMRDPWIRIPSRYPVGAVVEATVVAVGSDHAYLQLEPGLDGRSHVREIANHWVDDVRRELSVGERRKVKILRVYPPTGGGRGKIDLSLKQAIGASLTLPRNTPPSTPPVSRRPLLSPATSSPAERPKRSERAARPTRAVQDRSSIKSSIARWLGFLPVAVIAMFVPEVFAWLKDVAAAAMERFGWGAGIRGQLVAGISVLLFGLMLVAAFVGARFFRAPLMLAAIGVVVLLFPFHQSCLWLQWREGISPVIEAATLGRGVTLLGWLDRAAKMSSRAPWPIFLLASGTGLTILASLLFVRPKR